MGVFAKTEHNEGAPSQHELACVYSECNTAIDQNQIVMELMRKIAYKNDLKCLLHENNDHILGKHEASSAIISIFFGDEILGNLDAVTENRDYSKSA